MTLFSILPAHHRGHALGHLLGVGAGGRQLGHAVLRAPGGGGRGGRARHLLVQVPRQPDGRPHYRHLRSPRGRAGQGLGAADTAARPPRGRGRSGLRLGPHHDCVWVLEVTSGARPWLGWRRLVPALRSLGHGVGVVTARPSSLLLRRTLAPDCRVRGGAAPPAGRRNTGRHSAGRAGGMSARLGSELCTPPPPPPPPPAGRGTGTTSASPRQGSERLGKVALVSFPNFRPHVLSTGPNFIRMNLKFEKN